MIIEITGKHHFEGIGAKTGKPYDFTDIYYLGRRKDVEGLVSVKKTVQGKDLAADEIVIGASYDMDVDDEGNIINIHRVRKPSSAAEGQQTKG